MNGPLVKLNNGGCELPETNRAPPARAAGDSVSLGCVPTWATPSTQLTKNAGECRQNEDALSARSDTGGDNA
jgi:hypothetical protein